MDQQVLIAPLDDEVVEEHPLLQDELLTQPALPVANEQHNINVYQYQCYTQVSGFHY